MSDARKNILEDPSLNVDAGVSGTNELGSLGGIPPDNSHDTDSDSDSDDVIPDEKEKEFDPQSIQFKELFHLVRGLFLIQFPRIRLLPEEIPATEGLYGRAPFMSRNPLRFFLFDKVKKVRPEVSGESLLWLRRVKSIFILFSIIVGARIRSPRTTLTFVPPQVINIFSRLSVNPLLSKMDCVSIPREEWMSLESLLCSLAETQSFSIWMLGVLLHHINDCSFVPSDINISERLCGSITSFNIRNHAFIVKAQAYLAQQRRSLQLFHLLPSVSAEQKACLLSTSPFEKDLFDPSVLPLSLSTKGMLLLLLILTLLSLFRLLFLPFPFPLARRSVRLARFHLRLTRIWLVSALL